MDPLPTITRLHDHVVRVLGQNPGKFTLQGTNTYLIGPRAPYILIDTGEADNAAYLDALADALADTPPRPAALPDVSDIIITHKHHDHVGGLPGVLRLLRQRWLARNLTRDGAYPAPRVHKFPLPRTYPPYEGLTKALDALEDGTFTPSPAGALHDLAHAQVLAPQSDPASTLRVVHTPGHTPDSICLFHAPSAALLTADTVLGGSTSVFADLAAYLSSLRLLLSLDPPYASLYPGHGPVVPPSDARPTIQMYITHRLEREAKVLSVLHADAARAWSVWDIVGTIYKAYPENLWEAAAHGIELHLRKLAAEGRVMHLGGEGKASTWELVEDH